MNDKGKGCCNRSSSAPPVSERVLIMSLGLLMTSVAYGAAENGLGEDCRSRPAKNSSPPQQRLNCTPVDGASQDDVAGDETAHEDQRRAVGDSAVGSDADSSKEAASAGADTGTNAPDTARNSKANVRKSESAAAAVEVIEVNVGVDGAAMPGDATVDARSDGGAADETDVVTESVTTGEEASQTGETADSALVGEQRPDPAASTGDTEQVAADGLTMQMESSTSAPEETELFNIDIEAAEATEDELPSGADRDLLSLGFATQRTSDDYEAHTYSLSYRNHRREWFWPWQEATTRGVDWGLDVDHSKGESGLTEFKALHGQGTLGFYLTRGSYLQAQVGRHTLEADTNERTITSRHVTAMLGLKSSFGVQLETGRDFIYTAGSVTGGITQQLTALDHAASFRWRPEERIRIQGRGGYRKHDESGDENVARHADLSALYGIYPGWPWVWAGVGAQVLKYEHEVPDYWSPTRFTAYGLRFESSFPLYRRLSASASANLNRQSENGSDGNGYEVRAGFQYRLYGQLYARLEMNTSKSLQEGSTWTADNVFFSLNGPLF